jgi:hypothetical protein
MDKHINVIPNISSIKNKKKVTIDPDVDFIMNKDKSDDVDIMKLSHKPTIEEQKTKGGAKKKWPLKIIGLIVVIVMLVIVLVFYVLKYNSGLNKPKTEKLQNPPEPRLKQYTQQTEKFDNSSIPQPSKKELLSTLKKLESIKEVNENDSDSDSDGNEDKTPPKKILTKSTKLSNDVKKGISLNNKPKVARNMNKEIIENQENDMDGKDEEDKQDNELANKFYNQLQNNIDDDDDETK